MKHKTDIPQLFVMGASFILLAAALPATSQNTTQTGQPYVPPQQQQQLPVNQNQTPVPVSPAQPMNPTPQPQAGAAYDLELNNRAREALFNDRTLSVATKNAVVVRTSDGTATVSGTVPNSTEAERVISVIRQVTGRDVINGLTTSMRTPEAQPSQIQQ